MVSSRNPTHTQTKITYIADTYDNITAWRSTLPFLHDVVLSIVSLGFSSVVSTLDSSS